MFVKHDQEKVKYYMVVPEWIRGVAEVLTRGAKKYSPDNWKRYAPTKERPESAVECYYSALMRHVEAWRMGETFDKETGLHHLLHASCCLMFMFWFDTTSREMKHKEQTKRIIKDVVEYVNKEGIRG